MTKPLNIVYASISGNTRAFVDRLTRYAQAQNAMNPAQPLIKTVEFDDRFDATTFATPYFAFVPTYLDGGDGIHTGYHEIMTRDFGDEIADSGATNLLGVVGSGNRNFNAQFGLTAKHYAQRFGVPLLGLYELRGNDVEAATIYAALVRRMAKR